MGWVCLVYLINKMFHKYVYLRQIRISCADNAIPISVFKKLHAKAKSCKTSLLREQKTRNKD